MQTSYALFDKGKKKQSKKERNKEINSKREIVEPERENPLCAFTCLDVIRTGSAVVAAAVAAAVTTAADAAAVATDAAAATTAAAAAAAAAATFSENTFGNFLIGT